MSELRTGYARDVTVAIRPAHPDDAPELGEVHVSAWQWAYRGLMPDDLLDSLRPAARARAWKAWLTGVDADEGFAAWVAEVDGQIVGFASSSDAREADLADGAVELLTLYLLEPHLRTGLGSRLLAAAETAWRDEGRTRAVLWVLADNDRSRRFYEIHGWVTEGVSKLQRFEPSTSAEAVRYEKDLTGSAGDDRTPPA